jgi:hypothetical protein
MTQEKPPKTPRDPDTPRGKFIRAAKIHDANGTVVSLKEPSKYTVDLRRIRELKECDVYYPRLIDLLIIYIGFIS